MPDYIEKQARIFRAGLYHGKGVNGSDFHVTVDDLNRIVAGTTSAAAIHAHDESNERLDYGTVDGLNVRGEELWGTLKLYPDAVPFLERNGLKSLSAGIPFDKSRLQELSFTRKPVIADAAMFSQPGLAFFSLEESPMIDLLATFAATRHNTPAGQMAIQEIHDAAARAGAVCDRKNAQMSSAHESTALQKIHDVAASHGAKCASGDAPDYARSMFSQSDNSADERITRMSFWNKLFGKDNPTDAEKAEFHEAIKPLLPQPPADNTAQFATLQKRIEEQDAQLFAQRMLASGRIVPTQVPTVIAEFSEAAEDDRLAPRTVTFSVGSDSKQGSRVDRVKAKYENAQPNRLTEELLPDGHYAALFNRETSGQTKEQKDAADEAEYKRTRAATSLGPAKN